MSEPTKSGSKKQTPISVINLENYVSPIITESASEKWVNYGEDNNYFEYLLDRYRGSPTNHALINGISQMLVGEGLKAENESLQPVVDELFTYYDQLKWSFDYKCFGYCIVQVIRTKDNSKVAKYEHTPVQNWRSGKADSKGRVSEMWYSDDWERETEEGFIPKAYPVFDPKKDQKLSIYCIKPYRAGSFYYPTVDYQGGLQYAHIEEEISNFHINNLLNGMFPGLLINFNNGDPGSTERRKMEGKVNNKWGGSSNVGRIIMAFNEDKESAATVEAIQQPDLDKMFDLLNTQSSDKIMISHRVISPTLFGVRTGAGLGNNADELRVSSILFEETVLSLNRKLIESNFDYLLEYAEVATKVKFKSKSPFKDFLNDQAQSTESPNKMTTDSGAKTENLSKEHNHKPVMSAEMEAAYVDMINPYGEKIDKDEFFEADASKVENEKEEEQLYSDNGDSR